MRIPPDVSVCSEALMNKASRSNHGARFHSQTPSKKKKKKKSPHSSLHLLQLDKISCLCSAVALIGQGGENRLLTQTQAAHSLTSVLVSLWTLMRKGLGFNSAELNWLCYECFVFSADRSLKISLPFFIAFKPQFYLLLH